MNSIKKFEIKKILIPIDFSETSLLTIKHAGFLAKIFQSEIYLLHVIEKNWESFSIVAPEIVIENTSSIIEKVENRLKELSEDIAEEYGVKVSTITTTGHIHTEVEDISKERNVDLIMMGTHGVSGVKEFFIGSNTYRVVTMADCPVLSVQTNIEKLGFSNIVVPIDHTLHTFQKLGAAVEMANRYGAKLHIAGLLDEDAEDVDLKKIELKIDSVKMYLDNHKINYATALVKGKNLANSTLEYAKGTNADLIIIMTEQSEDITGLFLGPYAQQVVNHSSIPVLSIKPNVNPNLIESVHPY